MQVLATAIGNDTFCEVVIDTTVQAGNASDPQTAFCTLNNRIDNFASQFDAIAFNSLEARAAACSPDPTIQATANFDGVTEVPPCPLLTWYYLHRNT